MASKKRSHDDDDQPTSKKRIVSDVNGSPVVNGVGDKDEPNDDDNLELFRKEAIFRKMRHYSRELGRSQLQIEELQRRRSRCEAGLAAIVACWHQIVETVQTLAKPEDLPSPSERVEVAFNISSCVQENTPESVKNILEARTNATQALVSRFFQLSPSHYSKLEDPSYLNYQTTQTECASLRSRVDSLVVQLQECEDLKEKYRQGLCAAENRIDRMKSISVRATERHHTSVNGHGESEVEAASRNPSPPAHNAGTSIHNGNDHHDWKSIAENRGAELDKAGEEIVRLTAQIVELNTQITNPPIAVISEHPHYKFILEKLSHMNYNVAENEAKVTQAHESLHQAVQARRALEESIPVEHNLQIQELKTAIARRDTDIARLREVRDQQQAELNERRQKDSVKMTSVQELKSLAESREEMISSLRNQLRQTKAQLAAGLGNEHVMKFLFEPHDISFVEDLQQRLTIANEQLDAYRRAIALYESDKRLAVEEHRRTLESLARAEANVGKYRDIYGSSSMSAESTALSEELSRKAEELRRLKLEGAQRMEAESSLYAELDKLSAAWEGLDRQLQTKVFDLASLEDRVAKSGVDRAKSENKYYQAMREKEAIEVERKNLQRVVEKQEKVMERTREEYNNLRQQMVLLEQETEQYKASLEIALSQVQALDNEYLKSKGSYELEVISRKAVQAEQAKTLGDLELEKAVSRKARETAKEAQKEAERQAARAKVVTAGAGKPSKQSDLQMQLDETLAVLKCSTCKQSMRSIILSKCLHTFCKDCIDARISTRQRKCPSCNLAFSHGDVMQMYFQ